MESAPLLPIIAIVGRPNVGKSTLFNRYAGYRRALVEDSPGITRDRIVEEIDLEGRRILLVDTAGLDPAGDEMGAAIQAQARVAVEEADAILFVVDGQVGLLPEDEAIARTLRRSQKPLAVAVNKVDVPQHNDRVTEFYQLGLEPIHATSAEHGTGAFDALEALAELLPPTVEPPQEEEGVLRVAVVGRPNVGKSSLVNRLVGSDRVVVSEVAGTTRDSVDLRLEHDGHTTILVDTAGLRRPGRRDRTAERGSALMTVRALERATVALIVVDSEEGFTDQDAAVARMVRDRGRAAAVLANKWDLVDAERAEPLREEIMHGLRFMSDAPLITLSAKTGARAGRVLPLARQLAEVAERRISTSDLNKWLEDSVRRHEPAMARKGTNRRPIKFFYATQAAVRPPTFVLFCTDPRAVQPSYRRFLENQLRERFDLAGTPVRLRLRPRRKDS